MTLRVPLELKWDGQARRVAGWFLPGATPRDWITELAGCGVPLVKLRLYVVPRSFHDRRPCGVLCLANVEFPRPPRRGEAYTCLAGQCYLPADAQLEPPLSDSELAAQLSGDVSVFHPAAGLVSFAAEDVLSISDLFLPHPPRDRLWDAADAGIAPLPALTAILIDEPPGVDALMRGMQDEIGSHDPSRIPHAPGENPSEPPPNWLQKFGQWLTKAAQQGKSPREPKPGEGAADRERAGQPPGGAGGMSNLAAGAFAGMASLAGGQFLNFVERLGNWLAQPEISKQIQSEREKEIQRLLDLLAQNPDEGLRYALPMGGGASRGTALPGTNLVPRSPTFQLGQLDGGGPADLWQLPHEMQAQLRQHYLTLASRALQMGQHRRAAYIYAQLLGDYRAAADALSAGAHYHEAAVIYRDHLQQPMLAAQCLEKGGLLLDAAEIYFAMSEFLKAGELYRKIKQEERAVAALLKGVEKLVAARNFLEAAKVLDEQLNSTDEAIALLGEAWRTAGEPQACLEERFRLLGRHDRHAETTKIVRELRDLEASTRLAPLVARSLATVQRSYPNAAVQSLAADATKVVVGTRLPRAEPIEVEQLTKTLELVAQHDVLLRRDGIRYVQERTQKAARKPLPQRAVMAMHGWKNNFLRSFQLPSGFTWQAVQSGNRVFWAAGSNGARFAFVACTWNGDMQVFETQLRPQRPTTPILLAPDVRAGTMLLFKVQNTQGLIQLTHNTSALPWGGYLTVSSPAWLADDVVGLARSDLGTISVLARNASGLQLRSHEQNGNLLESQVIGYFDELAGVETLPTAAVRGAMVFGLKQHLLACHGPDYGWRVELLQCHDVVESISHSFAHSRARLAASFAVGGQIVWLGGGRFGVYHRFGEELASPRTGFTKSGALVAAGANRYEIYATQDMNIALRCRGAHEAGPPLGIVTTNHANLFGLVSEEGKIEIYELNCG